MIENLKCCLAHPMTALRTLKEKINELITGHNELVEKVDNLPAGGGEGGTGGEAHGPSIVYIGVQASWDMIPNEDPVTSNLFNVIIPVISADKTYDEICALINDGNTPIVNCNVGEGESAMNIRLQLTSYVPGADAVFCVYMSGASYLFNASPDGFAMMYKTPEGV